MTSPTTNTPSFGGPNDPSDRSDIEAEAIQQIRDDVETLCSQYSTADAAELKHSAEVDLRSVEKLLARRVPPADRRALLEQAGWLTLLIAALAFDLGDAEGAEHARQKAFAIGTDLQHPSILGWAHETAVWIEISNSNWATAKEKAAAGLSVAGENEPTGVAIQLALQQAEASARSGDAPGAEAALQLARRLLQAHPPPPNPQNHFVFDHAKFDLREMRIWLVSGKDDEAETVALRLQQELQNPDGTASHPMRSSEVLASLGLIAARRGQIDRAVDLTNQAIDIGRQSRLSFQQVTSAVADELSKHPHHKGVQELLDRRASLAEQKR